MNFRGRYAERILFSLLVLANTWPVLSHTFFPTLDGPLHVYNAHLIKELLTGNDTVAGYFSLNPFPVPNWTGHFIIAMLNLAVPLITAEKIFLLLYLIALPFAFRFFISTFKNRNMAASYLILPFCYSYMFFLGFYNFCIALVFLFLSLALWNKYLAKGRALWLLLLFFSILICYFSHIFVFGILMLGLGVLLLIHIMSVHGFRDKLSIRKLIIKSALLLLCCALPLIWALMFYLQKPQTIPSYLPETEMWRNIWVVEPLIGFVQQEESEMSRYIFFGLAFLAIVVIIKRITATVRAIKNEARPPLRAAMLLIQKADMWLLFCVLLMAAYYLLPDSDGWAGYFSLRILLLFFMFFIVWLGTQNSGRIIGSLVIIFVFFFGLKLMIYRQPIIQSLNDAAYPAYQASENAVKNKSLYFINQSANWLHGHFAFYTSYKTTVIILQNHECNTGYFPLVFNQKSRNSLYVSPNTGADSCYLYPVQNNHLQKPYHYLYIFGMQDTTQNPCNTQLIDFLDNYCEIRFSGSSSILAEIK